MVGARKAFWKDFRMLVDAIAMVSGAAAALFLRDYCALQ